MLDREIETSRTEKIICPNCAQIQDAQVIYYKGDPWESYVHNCIRCQYVIMESEWHLMKRMKDGIGKVKASLITI
jgi:hypothetical protein